MVLELYWPDVLDTFLTVNVDPLGVISVVVIVFMALKKLLHFDLVQEDRSRLSVFHFTTNRLEHLETLKSQVIFVGRPSSAREQPGKAYEIGREKNMLPLIQRLLTYGNKTYF